MQLPSEARDLKTNITGETIEFRIDATTKAFHVLSNALYKDKIAAIIRELGTNALDAHRAKGIDTPFNVHLPTRFEPFFEITDFGPGLTQQQIRDLYSIYFRSDKDHDNTAIGGLGLGSKTPFSYADSFIVLSKAAGIATTWNPYIDENGKMCIRKVQEEPCDVSDTGVKITIPTRVDDIPAFRERALRIYEWFDIQPRITGLDYQTLRPVEYALRTSSYGFISTAKTYSDWDTPAHVVMGCIAYPLDWSQLEHQLGLMGLKPKAIKTLRELRNLVLFAEIGSIDITPSREALSYTKPSVRKLIQVLDDTLTYMGSEVRAAIDKCTNAFDAWVTFDDLHNANIPQPLLQANNTWNGVSLAEAPRIYFPFDQRVQVGLIHEIATRTKGSTLRPDWSNTYRYRTHHFNKRAPHLLWIHGKSAKKWHAILLHNQDWLRDTFPLLLVKAENRAALNQIQIEFDQQCRITDFADLDPLPKRVVAKRTPGTPRVPRTKRVGQNFALRELTIIPGARYLSRYQTSSNFILSALRTFNSVTDPVPTTNAVVIGKASNPLVPQYANYVWDPLLPIDDPNQRLFSGQDLYNIFNSDAQLRANQIFVTNYRSQKTVTPHITNVPTLKQLLTDRFTELDTAVRATQPKLPYSLDAKNHPLWGMFYNTFNDANFHARLLADLPTTPLLLGFTLRKTLDAPVTDYSYLNNLNYYINRTSYTAPKPVPLPTPRCPIFAFLHYISETYPLMLYLWSNCSSTITEPSGLHYIKLCDAATQSQPVQLGVAA